MERRQSYKPVYANHNSKAQINEVEVKDQDKFTLVKENNKSEKGAIPELNTDTAKKMTNLHINKINSNKEQTRRNFDRESKKSSDATLSKIIKENVKAKKEIIVKIDMEHVMYLESVIYNLREELKKCKDDNKALKDENECLKSLLQ